MLSVICKGEQLLKSMEIQLKNKTINFKNLMNEIKEYNSDYLILMVYNMILLEV